MDAPSVLVAKERTGNTRDDEECTEDAKGRVYFRVQAD
jgi:hypothetical protein